MRIIVHTAKGPKAYKTPNGETIYICMCGLSQTYPICHGDHARVRNEEDNKVYIYDQQGNRIGEFKDNVNNLRKV